MMIRMWKIAQTVPATMCSSASAMPPTRQREGAAQQGDQQEDQFAGVHVAEQPHAVRDGLGDELDHLHREVDDAQQQRRQIGFLLVPNGAVKSSCTQPPRPLILML